MGGGSSSGGLSSIFGGGGGGSGQSFDPTTGAPIGPSSDFWGGAFGGNPTDPAVAQSAPEQSTQTIQSTASPTATGQQSGSPGQSLMQNLSSIFLGGQGSPSALAGLTGGGPLPASATPAPTQGPGWPTAQPQAPGSAAAAPGMTTAAIDPYSQTGLYPQTTPATVSPQSAPVSGKTQAEIPPEAPAPAPETVAPAAAANTTNYPDVSGTSREAGMGPTGPTTIDTGVSAAGTGIPPVLQDLFSLNFGRFIADLLGQQGMPANQNQAAAPPPSDSATAAAQDPNKAAAATPDTSDTGTKTAQGPIQKAAGAAQTVAGALKPKQSPIDASGTPAAATPAAPAPAAPAVPTAPQTPAAMPEQATPSPDPAAIAGAAPGTIATARTPAAAAPPSALGNLISQGLPPATAALPPAAAPTGAPGAPEAAPPGGSDFAAWREQQIMRSDPETQRMYRENQARPDATAPAGAPGSRVASLGQPPGGQPTPDGGRAPTNGMPGGLTPNAPPAIPPLGAAQDQSRRLQRQGGHTNHYEGTLTMPDGQTFRYGTGGGQFASMPYGTYQVHPGAVGSVGKSIGAWAGVSDSNNPGNNTVHDPLYRGAGGTNARAGVEIHPDVSGRRLITNGCIGIDRGQSAAFGRSFKSVAATGQKLMITIEPGGKATMFYANASPAVAGQGQGNAILPPPNAAPKYDPRFQRAGVVGG